MKLEVTNSKASERHEVAPDGDEVNIREQSSVTVSRPMNMLATGSSHYDGIAGSGYFDWQNKNAAGTAGIEARKFRAFVKRTDRVLDFGCGGGHVLRNLECGRRVGVEINPVARRFAQESGIECHATLAEVEDNFFDVIISNHALEHVPFPIMVLKGFREKLAPSGVLLLCVPIDDWRAQRDYTPTDINHHLHTWTPQLLGNSLVEAGFSSDDFSIKVLAHAWIPKTAIMYRRLPRAGFDLLCRLFAILTRRRQLFVVARKTFIA
jgi:2-polyprenyl-3-methyl-5-hydroxy-6-metoxy-1,4-benzoquinol methylase